MGKLFTSIISQRLHVSSDSVGLISNLQAGFRKSYSTVDHVYVLKALIDIFNSTGKKLFCSFLVLVKHLILFGEIVSGWKWLTVKLVNKVSL